MGGVRCAFFVNIVFETLTLTKEGDLFMGQIIEKRLPNYINIFFSGQLAISSE